nr:reverse transcriptase domain-containing protein [Tanacetum cinerariifolium]
MMNELTFPAIPRRQLTDEPIILEGIIGGNRFRRILVDGGSSSEIMYEHCFKNLDVNIRSRIQRCKALMTEQRGHKRSIHHQPGTSGPIRDVGSHVDNQLQAMTGRRRVGKHGEEDEEKTGFHMEKLLYCFTYMPTEFKNSTATLQRMMEKVNAQPKQETPHKFNSDAKGLEIVPMQRSNLRRFGHQNYPGQTQKKMYLYAIWLKFKASNYAMDCEALLAGLAASANQGLAASANQGMKDLHVFIDLLTLFAQIEGNHTPSME